MEENCVPSLVGGFPSIIIQLLASFHVSESCLVQYEENKAHPEKNKKHFKTPSQLQGLEDFYNENKYPTESMKVDIAEKLGLTEKQVSGWFCHRRLKDKRRDETLVAGRQDLPSGVIQDRGSGLKQDSCSSTKQGDHRVADIREVESRRFGHDNFPAVELKYEPRRFYDGAEMDDTSSGSDSGLEERFCPQNRSPLDLETMEHLASNGSIAITRGHMGPSGYLKIKGQMENAAITAVKKQLGSHFRVDGPSLGIEFDPLPPEVFESLSKNINNDVYGVSEPIASSFDISGVHKRSSFSTMREQGMYLEATDYRSFDKSNQHNFSYRQLKQKYSFPNRRHVSSQKSSIGVGLYSSRGISEFNNSIDYNILGKLDHPGMNSDSYSVKHPEPWSPSYDVVNPKVARKRDRLDFKPADSMFQHKDPTNFEDRVPSTKQLEECQDDELYMERKPMSEHLNSMRFPTHTRKDLQAGKRGREELLLEDYTMRTSSQEQPIWSRQMKGSTLEMPPSFSEDETAKTSSSEG